MSRLAEYARLLNLAEHLLAPCSLNSVGEGVEHTEEMRDELRAEIVKALTAPEVPQAPRLEMAEKPLGEGPQLYAVVVHGPKHRMPTLWLARAYDYPAAELFAAKEAGYTEDDLDDALIDSMLIGTLK